MMGYRRLIDCDQLFEDDELFEAIGNDGVLLYIRLWSLAECWGGLEDNCKSISRQSGALSLSPQKVEKIIRQLIEMGKIYRYELEEKSYLWLKNLPKHQKMVKLPKSKLPVPRFVHEESHEYESKTCYTYRVLDEFSPQNRTSEELLKNVSRMTQSKAKQSKSKNKDKSTDHRQNIPDPDQDNAVPLTGDDFFFSYLKANASKDCRYCKGVGNYREDFPCMCVTQNLEAKIAPILKEAFETVKQNAEPRCRKCLGFGVIVTENDGIDQCLCSKVNRRKVDPDAQTDGIWN